MDSGEASLEAAASLAPDLVLMDVHLPGIDGLEATRRLAALPRAARRAAAVDVRRRRR